MTPSATTWRRVIKQARDGSPRHLLELLLQPHSTDNHGRAKVGPNGERPFYDLPDDEELREQIVAVLLFGPWPRDGTIDQLFTHDGWGKGKPRVSDLEVFFAEYASHFLELDGLAESLGVEPETLRRRIAEQRKPKK